jgi:hypothetical protein
MSVVSWPIGPVTSNMPARPARPPLTSIATQISRFSLKPAKRAARGASPTTRNWKPSVDLAISAQTATAASGATRQPRWTPVPATRIGVVAESGNIAVCGKPKPCGSFHGPVTR